MEKPRVIKQSVSCTGSNPQEFVSLPGQYLREAIAIGHVVEIPSLGIEITGGADNEIICKENSD